MDDLVETYNYRGLSLPVYIDSDLNFYYTIIAGKQIKIGSADRSYRKQIENLVDKQFDWIADVESDAWLEWFDNAGHLDIRLKLRDRIVKVFLVDDQQKINDVTIGKLVTESKLIIKKVRG